MQLVKRDKNRSVAPQSPCEKKKKKKKKQTGEIEIQMCAHPVKAKKIKKIRNARGQG